MIPELAKARAEFQALVGAITPELHRYCARLTGSIVDGEDVVQEALAKAFYALSMSTDTPPLRPWLFRIAHNAAIDHLRKRGREQLEEDVEPAGEPPPDPEITRLALRAFLALPVRQRSAVILKDVLGQSLEEIAAALDTTVPAVKAALVRGRSALRAGAVDEPAVAPHDPAERALLARYVALFNARDWPGLEAMLAEDARLDLVAQARREGRAVGEYYSRYRKADVRMELGTVDGRDAILVFEPTGAERPAYFILLGWRDGRVATIRDYRYARYVADDLT
jgi:RNA polymerase sigma-70 factor (ECF subfamily)